MFQRFLGRDALLGVDGEHLRDEILRLRADFTPVLVVEAVHALLDFGEEPRLLPRHMAQFCLPRPRPHRREMIEGKPEKYAILNVKMSQGRNRFKTNTHTV